MTKLLGTPLAGELSMEEHRQRVSAATNAVTLGNLQALVDDLQTAGTALQVPGAVSPKSPKFAA